MAVEIEFLKGLPNEAQIRLLNEMSLSGDNVPIQIDGEVFFRVVGVCSHLLNVSAIVLLINI